MQQAHGIAQRRRHEYMGTEHILLGLAEHRTGVAVSVLRQMSIDLSLLPAIVGSIVEDGEKETSRSRLTQTPRARKVIERAMEEARILGHRYVGTEHLLLGLLRVRDGVAACALERLQVDLPTVRDSAIEFLDTPEYHARNEECANQADRVSVHSLLFSTLVLVLVVIAIALWPW